MKPTIASFLSCALFILLAFVLFSPSPAFGQITVDAKISGDQSVASSTISAPVISTTSGNELLLAFVATDYLGGTNTKVNSVTGGGLTWALVVRANARSGSSEIWRAFAPASLSAVTVTATLSQSVVSSITVMSFIGVDTSGTNGSGAIGATKSANAASGAPAASVVTTRSNSWVFGVGNDFDNAIPRTVGTGQSLVHQCLTPTGDTYWMQMQNAPTPVSGTTVSINDSAPTGDMYNLAAVEILPPSIVIPTYTLSGTISPGTSGTGSTVTLTGASGGAVTADSSGNYSFSGLANGSYTVTPSKSGFTFTPPSQTVTIASINPPAINFAIQPIPTYSISGAISPSTSGAGSTVTLSGASGGTVTADTSGNYSFVGLANGSYTVTPSKSDFTFTPPSQTITIASINPPAINFAIQPIPTYSISGSISPGTNGTGTTVTVSGTSGATVTADSSGNYTFTGLANGSYTVTPSKSGFTFTPPSQTVTIAGINPPGVNFAIQPIPTYSISGAISPSTSGAGATVTLSGTPGATVTADGSGSYSFTGLANGSYTVTPSKTGLTFSPTNQTVVISGTSPANVNFTAQTAPPPTTLTVDAKTYADSGQGNPTISSPQFSTTIGNELLLAFVATDYLGGTNTAVTSLTGGGLTWVLVVRANTQKGGSEIWRAFAPAPLSAVTVTATLSQSVVSSITVMSFIGVDTSGTNGSGAIGATKSANAASGAPAASVVTTRSNSWVFGVGNDFDNAIPRTVGTGQSLVHQYLTPTGDTYWMQMQNAPTPVSGTTVSINDTAPTGDRYNLAAVEVLPAASTGGGTPPTVTMTAPSPNSTVTGKTTVSANASDPTFAITGVQFLLDGKNLGTEVTTAPYAMTWDTTTAAGGAHTLAATAFSSSGLTATSASVAVTVNNSGNVAVVGSWSSPVTIPTVAVNLVLLRNNTLLFYEDGNSPTVWDYVNNTFLSVPTAANLFCSGHALMADGRVLVVGGFGGNDFGISNAEIFDPTNNSWTALPNMSYKRWYPTATTLSDGRIIVMAGWQTTSHTNAGIPEIYDPVGNKWTQLTSANNPFETYPFIYLLPDGRLVHVGGTEYATVTEVLDVNTQTWSSIDSRIIDGGSSTMYLPGHILKAGSATDSQSNGASSNTAYTLDMTSSTPTWQPTASMNYARSFLNLTTLPDGTVLATGGESDRNGGNINNAVYAAELWSPQTQTWSIMASMHTPREYHSTAVLLPDGRVLESGMGADFGNVPNEMSAEFYSPPYLFKGARPTISQAPTQISYNSTFSVSTPDGVTITSAVLIRTGAVTHFFDQNTRFVPVSFTLKAGGLTVTSPLNGNQAPPGYYMLFLVNNNGVPSVAPIIQLGP